MLFCLVAARATVIMAGAVSQSVSFSGKPQGDPTTCQNHIDPVPEGNNTGDDRRETLSVLIIAHPCTPLKPGDDTEPVSFHVTINGEEDGFVENPAHVDTIAIESYQGWFIYKPFVKGRLIAEADIPDSGNIHSIYALTCVIEHRSRGVGHAKIVSADYGARHARGKMAHVKCGVNTQTLNALWFPP
jgi:hypothetical protein